MSEIWVSDNESATMYIYSCFSSEYHAFHYAPRPDKNGGGVGCLISKSLQNKKQQKKTFESFECLYLQLSYAEWYL